MPRYLESGVREALWPADHQADPPGWPLATSGLWTGWEQPLPPGTLAPTSPLPVSVQIG